MINVIPTFKRRSGITIPRSYESEEFYKNIKRDLTRRSKQYNSEDFVTNIFYVETEKSLMIPRYFPINKYVPCNIEDVYSVGEDIAITHSIKPRDEIQERFMNIMINEECGLIQLEPGVGKTVITIYAIAHRKKKSIILVHRKSLVEQWAERFTDFTSIPHDDIGILSSTNIEESFNKPICISTAQSFLSCLNRKGFEFLMALNDAKFGNFIGDEVHTSIGAPSFSECSIHLPTSVNFGLSATPKRFDGNSDIIEYHVGNVYKDESSGSTIDARVTALLFNFEIDTPYRQRYLHWEGRFQRSRYLNIIKNSKIFMTIAKSILDKLNSHSIIMCERLKLIDELFKYCKSNNKTKFVAGVSNDVLTEQVVFATPGKMRDGVDAAWKDTVVLTSPISNIKQMCGRIVRPFKGKKESVIIDMVDVGCNAISRTFHGRLDFYKSKGWKINFVYIDKDLNKHVVDEKDALKIIKG